MGASRRSLTQAEAARHRRFHSAVTVLPISTCARGPVPLREPRSNSARSLATAARIAASTGPSSTTTEERSPSIEASSWRRRSASRIAAVRYVSPATGDI